MQTFRRQNAVKVGAVIRQRRTLRRRKRKTCGNLGGLDDLRRPDLPRRVDPHSQVGHFIQHSAHHIPRHSIPKIMAESLFLSKFNIAQTGGSLRQARESVIIYHPTSFIPHSDLSKVFAMRLPPWTGLMMFKER